MHRPRPPLCVLIAMELGAEWPGWVAECRMSAGRSLVRRVTVEHDGESPQAFAERTLERARMLAAEHANLLLVLACNQRADGSAEHARLTLVSNATQLTACSRVVLAAERSATERLRESLSGLALVFGPAGRATSGPARTSVVARFGSVVPRWTTNLRPAHESGHVRPRNTLGQVSSLVP